MTHTQLLASLLTQCEAVIKARESWLTAPNRALKETALQEYNSALTELETLTGNIRNLLPPVALAHYDQTLNTTVE